MTLAVFLPGIMGAGIVLSVVILVADALRRVLPSGSERRSAAVARGVDELVARTAQAASRPIAPRAEPARDLRSRTFYALLATLTAMAAAYLINGGVAVYTGEGGLAGNPWPLGWGVGTGATLGLVSLGASIVAVVHHRLPSPLRRFIAGSPIGRLRAPDPGYAERARRLAPPLREGDS
ncbi:MAG TPA: hypothetical protein VLL51_02995 [Gemmatimonadales bacterium]|nr:hypothetical protein [Gemmatimonadales bacterium]